MNGRTKRSLCIGFPSKGRHKKEHLHVQETWLTHICNFFVIYCVFVTRFNNYHQFLISKHYHVLRCFTYIRKIAFFDSTQEVLFKPTRLYISNWRWTYNNRYSSQNNFLHFISFEVTHNCLFVCESISGYW